MTDRDSSPNAFERDKPGTNARTDAEGAIEELRQRGGVFVEAVRATRMPMVLTDPNLPGNPIVFANQSFLKLSGYRMDEVLGQQPHFMNGSGTDPKDAPRFAEMLRSEQDEILETVQYRKDGSPFVATVLLSAFKDEDGRTLNHFMSWLDVTRRVDAEAEVAALNKSQTALRESEERYRRLFESMDEAYAVVEVLRDEAGKWADFRFVEVNPAFLTHTAMPWPVGKTATELLGTPNPRWAELYGQALDTGEAIRIEEEEPLLDKVFDLNIFTLHRERNRVAVLFTDITERKRVHEALRASEERLRSVLDGMDEAFGLMDRDLRIITQNKAALEMDGRPLEDLQGRKHSEVYPDTAPEVIALYERALAERRPVSLEHRYPWDKNRASWLEMRAFPVPEGLAVFWRDISERKEAEQALRESEEKYRSLFEEMDEGFAVCELVRDDAGRPVDFRYLDLNPALMAHVGIAPETLRGRLATEAFPDRDPWYLETYAQVVESGQSVVEEHYFEHVDRWLRLNVFPRGGDRFAVLYSDITDRKRGETISRESEQRQSFLLKLTDSLRPLRDSAEIQAEATGLLREYLACGWCYYVDWDLDRKTGVVLRDSVGEGLASLAGAHDVSDAAGFLQLLAGGEVLTVRDYSSYDQLPTRIRQQFTALGFRSMMAAPLVKEGRLIATLIAGDTEVRDWSANEETLLVEVAERTWAAIERARAEAALRESEERLRKVINAETVGVVFFDLEGGISDSNDAFLRMIGFTRQELEAGEVRYEELTPPDWRWRDEQTIAELKEKGEAGPYEKEYCRKDGSKMWILCSSSLLDPHTAVEFVTDVTESKRAEEALRESDKRARLLLAELQHRVRNILAMIRSIARRTEETTETVEDYVQHLEGRISAMARTQALLTRDIGAEVDLQNLLLDELDTQAAQPEQYRLTGPDVSVPPKAAEVLGLALHELATNSVKYGALSGTEGSLDVRWALLDGDEAPQLSLVWSESGVDIPKGSRRQGFGTELITNRVPYELRGTGTMEFLPKGFVATIEFPLTNAGSILQSDEGNRR